MQQIGPQRVQDLTGLGGESNSLGIVQEIEVWPYYLMVYAQTRFRVEEWDAYNSLGF